MHTSQPRFRYLALAVLIFCTGALEVGLATLDTAPQAFNGPLVVEVTEGEGLASVADHLQQAGVISSAFWFRTIAILREGETKLYAGAYRFNKPTSEYAAVTRLLTGDYGVLEYRITIPEGFTGKEIALRIASTTGNPEFEDSVELFSHNEGYLFPETYFINELSTPETIIEAMRAEFVERVNSVGIQDDVLYEFYGRTYTADDIVILASIVEGEANTPESRRMIADILWRRLSIDKPLQVDATLAYITGKTSAELTKDDLADIHDFNTYTMRGLPPRPINNPGEDALMATLRPTKNPYLYFLTGDDGEMYYAETFEEHLKNQRTHIQSID